MKEVIQSIKKYIPESSIRIKEILQQLLNEVEFVIENFTKEGYIPSELTKIYDELEQTIEDLKLGYGQLNLLDGIQPTITKDNKRPNYDDYIVVNTIPHSLLENFTHIKPYGFIFMDSEMIEAKSWKVLYIKACEMFIKINKRKFFSFENKTAMNGILKDYFSKEKDNIDTPIILDKIYINIKFDANGFRDMLIKILKEYDYNVEDFKVFFRADYNPLHR